MDFNSDPEFRRKGAFISPKDPFCPPGLIEKAKQLPAPRVVVAGSESLNVLMAVKDAVDAGMVEPLLTGSKTEIFKLAETMEWDVSGHPIIEAEGEEGCARAACLAVREGKANAILKGHIHTDVLLKAAVNKNDGIRTGKRFVHIFHISVPGGRRPMLISDAAVNVNPDIETRKQSCRSIVKLSHALGNKNPLIAFLSATETPIASVPCSLEAAELCAWANENIANATFGGPYALDLIVSEDAVEIKGLKDDPVAGRADGIIVPDLVSGNTLFKSLVFFRGGCAGGIVLGGQVPILLTSRADPPAARLASLALASITIAHSGSAHS